MLNRYLLVGISGLGLFSTGAFCGTTHIIAAQRPAIHAMDDDKGDKDDDKDEQKVPVDQLPQAVVDTVKQEVPGGTITEAELEQKHGKSVYEMDVKGSDSNYEIKTDQAGKFISKEVDDDGDDKK